MTIPEICPAIDFEECCRIHGYYYLYDGSNGAGDEQRFELAADDTWIAQVMEYIRTKEA